MATPVLADKDHNSVARILNLPAPASDNEPARKIDLTAAIEGLAWKDNVRAASTGNVNTASPGSAIDSVTLTSGDRILLKDQTAPAQNGIYVWTGAASPLTRAADASTGEELVNAVVIVDEGSSNAGTKWRQSEVAITLDTDDVVFGTFVDAVADASETVKGKIEIATQAEADGGTDDVRALTPLKAKTASWRGRGLVQSIGDGSSTQYDVTHNFNTYNVHVEVWQTSGSRYKVECDISQPSVNAVRINTAAAVASNALSVRIREVPGS